MKRITLLVYVMVVLLCGCNVNEVKQQDAGIDKISEDYYYAHDVLTNGNLLELYTDESSASIIKGTVTDAKSGEFIAKIDLSSFHLSTGMSVQKLKDGFCIIDRSVLFFDLKGNLVAEQELPKDKYANTECAISNDMKKIAYIMKEELNEEDILTLAIKEFKSGSVEKLEKLNNAGIGKPSYYQSLRFTEKDDKVLFYGVTNPAPDVCLDCYGWVDIKTKSLRIFEDENIEVEFSGDSIWVYDTCVEKGETSSGIVRQLNATNDVDQKFTLKNVNESQYLRGTDNENCFITMLPDEDEKKVTFKLYKKGIFEKAAIFNFDDAESFDSSTTGSAEFNYSTVADKVYFNYFTYANKEDWGTVLLASIYLGE